MQAQDGVATPRVHFQKSLMRHSHVIQHLAVDDGPFGPAFIKVFREEVGF